MKPLTDKQQQTLDFIRGYIRANGMAPTMQEIASGMSWKSPNAAQGHVDSLQRKGRLKVKRGINRGIVLAASSYEHDSQALEAASRIMAIVGLAEMEKEKWPDVRLKAAIQVEVIDAMQWAAGQTGN